MKGIVFTEFMALVEQTWGDEMVDYLIDEVDPASGGAYTSVGTYEFAELQAYLAVLTEKTQIPASELIYTYGVFLAGQFVKKFPLFFEQSPDLFSLLKNIDQHIHVEVRKLYPDAELPEFAYELSGDGQLRLFYRSSRHLQDLAHGLIQACADYYHTPVEIERQNTTTGAIAEETFSITLK